MAAKAPPEKPASTPAIDPAALHALEVMSGKLRELTAFTVDADATRQLVLDNGQRIDTSGTVSYAVRKPDRFFASIDTDRQLRRYYFDGANLTMYAPRMNFFAVIPMKGTVADLVLTAKEKFGIDMPLADLFLWGTERAPLSLIDSATVIGPAHIAGAECDQLAFRQKDVDWQLWIDRETLLPRKLVIVDHSDPALPQYSAVLTWNTNPKFTEAQFTFSPGKDDHRIEIHPANEAGASEEGSP